MKLEGAYSGRMPLVSLAQARIASLGLSIPILDLPVLHGVRITWAGAFSELVAYPRFTI
jgi:hypothetical protein